MSKFAKRLAVGTMCATMVLGSTMTAFADDVTTLPDDSNPKSAVSSTGKVEGYLPYNITKVVLPTDAVIDNITLDPQGLLYVADSSTYATGSGAVYFGTSGATSSSEVEIINKSSFGIDVKFTVKLTAGNNNNADLSQIKLVDEAGLAKATDPSLFFGVKIGEKDPVAITSSEQTITESAKGVSLVTSDSENGYKLDAATTAPADAVAQTASAGTSGKIYYYAPTSGYEDKDDQIITLTLEGKTNNVEAWSSVTETLALEITYIIEESAGSYLSATSISASSNSVTATLPSGVTITKVERVTDGVGTDWKASGTATVSGAKVTVKASSLTSNVGKQLRITYSDGHTDTIDIVS